MKELILIIVGSALVNNIILSQFQGLCPFLPLVWVQPLSS